MFWANVLQGILSPVLVVFLLLVGNNRKIMRSYRLSPIINIGLALTAPDNERRNATPVLRIAQWRRRIDAAVTQSGSGSGFLLG